MWPLRCGCISQCEHFTNVVDFSDHYSRAVSSQVSDVSISDCIDLGEDFKSTRVTILPMLQCGSRVLPGYRVYLRRSCTIQSCAEGPEWAVEVTTNASRRSSFSLDDWTNDGVKVFSVAFFGSSEHVQGDVTGIFNSEWCISV